MKRRFTFFLIFFLPVILVVVMAAAYSYWSLSSLRDEQQLSNLQQVNDLQMVADASRLGHDMLAVQQLINATLRQAKAGTVEEAAAYQVHVQVVDRLKDMARARRRDPSEAEKLLWSGLKDQKLGGFKFKRHQIVGSAIVDFACPARWLVVEISGPGANAELDALKDRKLTDVGIRVLRFSDEAVLGDADGVLQAILAELEKPFDRKAALRRAANPHPNPSEEGEAQKLQGISLEDSIG